MEIKRLINNYQTELDYFFDTIDTAQVNALFEKLYSCKGIIYFSGVGKSALIAEKIAGTMTSLSTKAAFLPPLEAMHGNIGIVGKDDFFVAISKSGETDELLALLPFLRSRGTEIAVIVSNEKSRLAKSADLVVNLPINKELCPFNMAPTVSTTAALILGDILAIALMEKHRITIEDYAANHPAGTIGKRLTMKVEDLMLRDDHLPLVSPETKVVDILVELSEKKAGAVLAVNKESILQGIFTDGDLRRALLQFGEHSLQKSIHELMTKSPKTVGAKTLALDALKKMESSQKSPITVLPVTNDQGKVLGLIKMHDILQAGI